MAIPGTTGLDARALDSLRQQAARDPHGATRQAAVQFEAQFMQLVLKSMRDATPQAEPASTGQTEFTRMLDAQFAQQFAGRPGGLADLIERQLAQQMKQLPPPTEPPPAAPAATAPPAARPAGAPSAFLRDMLPHAQAAERATGVPAAYILGQAALESGWGRGEIRHPDGRPSFNLFAIKATGGWRGDSAAVMTTEFVEGRPQRQVERFRSYGSYAEAFTDYAAMLARSPRYAGVLREASTVEAFAGGMQRAGYATDPQYAAKLARTIHQTLAMQRNTGGDA
ncbi:flagellar assembly peptidoglycan hydrolase FlgJ [Ramlibacter sp. AW1]|uniref:Peptidoglycan hydrolase FlgJ n=1 Tax=Ramlibacter aurantiacus TaxID=2801330 RepID=A0A936ZP46_9BURK|nr:flagellar assembly peptidoglycan hydrolase FlgJ [Ramlibacter aurantiacus]MBL0423332.1 flagellar assembly peptidoglycan hydrolase FlgJ [Ramlibacter aurantiacus]